MAHTQCVHTLSLIIIQQYSIATIRLNFSLYFPTFCFASCVHKCLAFNMISKRWNILSKYMQTLQGFFSCCWCCVYMCGKPMPKFGKRLPTKLTGNKVLFTAIPQHKTKNYDLSLCVSLFHQSSCFYFYVFLFRKLMETLRASVSRTMQKRCCWRHWSNWIGVRLSWRQEIP